jgi:uncharacterized membrane protein YfcA
MRRDSQQTGERWRARENPCKLAGADIQRGKFRPAFDPQETPLSFPLDPAAALAVFALVAFGSCIQSSVGFGLGLIAAPFLFLIYPPLVPGPLMASSIALTLLIALREREAIDFHGLGFAVAGRILGTLAAALVWTVLPSENFDFLFAALVLLGVAISLSSLRVEPKPTTAAAAGALSGFMGTISSIGGPPMALLYQREHGPRIRGTLSGHFVIGALISLVALAAVGQYGRAEIILSIELLPAIVAGYLASGWIRESVDRVGARPFVLGLSVLAAVGILYRAAS